LKKEINIFLTAVLFFTRIPVKLLGAYNSDMLNKASKYLPLIGYMVAGISAGVFYISNMFFSVPVSVIFSIIASVLTTGAFHEDGLADTFDAFGGGWNKEQKLKIMKDSRIGTYGSIALILAILFKFILLSEYHLNLIIPVIFVSQILSRLSPVVLIYFLNYVRIDDSSKSKPVGEGISLSSLLIAIIFAFAPLMFFGIRTLIIIPIIIITQFSLAFWFKKHLGGYTGDTLGASQQISELIILLSFLILWN